MPSAVPSARAARAHALKNCLAIIYAVSRLIENDVADRSRGRLERVCDAARRMNALIDEDLEAEAGAATRRHQGVVVVEDVVRAVVSRLEDGAETGGVCLVVDCGGGTMRGDAEDLAEALLNVVGNAVEATAAGGTVVVATKQSSHGDQEWVVRDAGCGMPSELLAQIGTPFCSRRAGGTGLGVAMAREVVSRHAGLLRIASAAGTGTTVTFWFPRADGRT